MSKYSQLTAGDLKGVFGFLLTPTKPEEERGADGLAVNVDEAARAADALVNDGVEGICLNGTFGEVPSLTWSELSIFTKTVVDSVAGRVPVFAGATTLNTRDTITRASSFREMGADGLLLGRPFMSPLSDPDIVRFYQDVAESLPTMPIFLYDDMEAFKRPIQTPVYSELAKIPQIIAAKYRTRLLLSELIDNSYNRDVEVVGSNIKLMPGEFDWYAAYRLFGVDSCWSSAVCAGPAPIMALRDALYGEKWEDAKFLTQELSSCYDGLVPDGNFAVWHQDKIAFMKARFAAAGYLVPGPALPPYHYLAEDRVLVAKECGRKAAELQRKYS
tara:strand:- start:6103 stop:7092 length:990 start_codon:yes stop_codon:yes gene_type:complete